jgi:hypothetical protein
MHPPNSKSINLVHYSASFPWSKVVAAKVEQPISHCLRSQSEVSSSKLKYFSKFPEAELGGRRQVHRQLPTDRPRVEALRLLTLYFVESRTAGKEDLYFGEVPDFNCL